VQTALLDSAPAVMLAMDYLAQQPYVDARRVELVGGSLGAFLVSVPGALDPRFRRVWLIHGAGDPRGVFAHLLEPYIGFGPLRELAAQLLALVTASQHLRPEKWVGRVAPRPIIVVNARGDESLPPASVAALHQALPAGSEIIWTEGPHVRPGRKTVVEGLVALVAERLRDEAPGPAAAQQPGSD
jgi:dienelactone hydrolase